MIGFAYLLFSYFEISHVTMILANGLFITGTYLTFLSFSVARRLQISRKKLIYDKKILIFGATGSVGSSLTKLVKGSSMDAHLIGKNER